MKEFNRKKDLEWVEFKLNGDVYRAVNVAPAFAVLDVASVNQATGVERIRLIMGFLDQVLHDDDAKQLSERMRDKTNPVDIEEMTDVAVWLVEEVYATERPTTAPSTSQDGSGSTGPSTTGTASTNGDQESTQEPSTRRVL